MGPFSTPSPYSGSREQLVPGLEQIRQYRQDVDLAAVLSQTTEAALLKAELLLDHPQWLFTAVADVYLGGLAQIVHASLRCCG